MKYCVNPYCQQPQNPDSSKVCQDCGSGLLLNHHYRPIQMIGQGGFGRTFKAIDEDSMDETKCLIKQFYPQSTTGTQQSKINILPNTLITSQQAANKIPEIYRTEVTQLAKLKHPQIPRLIAHFEQDGYSYIVQDFIDGINLEIESNRTGAFSEAQIWQLLNELLPVLKFIHDQNVIHRDIKPENIIRPEGNRPLVLVDFGAAKRVVQTSNGMTSNSGTAQLGTSIGTPNYIAPEQQKGREVFASDLYSLGVTCIRLLTNNQPSLLFDDGTYSWEWRSRSKYVSPNLSKILDKLLESGTKKRYKSADEVMHDIAALSPQKKPSNKQETRFSQSSYRNKSKLSIWEKISSLGTGMQGFAALVTIGITFGLIRAFTPSTSANELDKVSLNSTQGIDYSDLRQYLQDKNWKKADKETSEIILKISGEKSKSRGYINYNEMQKLSCSDLTTIDNLWRTASNGMQGFSAQQRIYEQQGQDWQKMYSQVGWGSFTSGSFVKTIKQEFDWQTRRIMYDKDKEPDFKNPPPGHLPVTISLVRGIAFPQFADICKF